jgi:methylase of polypeptide subunit release factors
LAAIRELLGTAGRVLRRGGRLVMELGAGQAAAARELAANHGWPRAETRMDAAGIERVLVARRGESADG